MNRRVATLLFVLGISAVFVAFSHGQTPSQTERRAIDPPTKPRCRVDIKEPKNDASKS